MSDFDPFRVRNIPKNMTGFQAITFLVENRCHAPWFLYFETLAPFVGDGILRLLEFGPLDLVRAYFRPAPFRQGRHFRRGRRGGRGPRGIPDPAESIAKRLPLATEAKGRYVSDGVRNLWLIDNVGQSIFNTLLVADVIDDGLVGWAQMLRSKACKGNEKPLLVATKEEQVQTGVSSWRAMDGLEVIIPDISFKVSTIHTSGPRGATVSFGASPVPLIVLPGYQTQIRIVQGGRLIGESSINNDPSTEKQHLASGYARGSVSYSGQTRVWAGSCVWMGAIWTVQEV